MLIKCAIRSEKCLPHEMRISKNQELSPEELYARTWTVLACAHKTGQSQEPNARGRSTCYRNHLTSSVRASNQTPLARAVRGKDPFLLIVRVNHIKSAAVPSPTSGTRPEFFSATALAWKFYCYNRSLSLRFSPAGENLFASLAFSRRWL